jgi:hypothetical protein
VKAPGGDQTRTRAGGNCEKIQRTRSDHGLRSVGALRYPAAGRLTRAPSPRSPLANLRRLRPWLPTLRASAGTRRDGSSQPATLRSWRRATRPAQPTPRNIASDTRSGSSTSSGCSTAGSTPSCSRSTSPGTPSRARRSTSTSTPSDRKAPGTTSHTSPSARFSRRSRMSAPGRSLTGAAGFRRWRSRGGRRRQPVIA